MSSCKDLESRAINISRHIQEYLDINSRSEAIPKDVMPYLIQMGDFAYDHRDGQPLRKILRELDTINRLDLIDGIYVERHNSNRSWYFRKGISNNIATNNIPEATNQIDKINYICPIPTKWNEVYNALIIRFESMTDGGLHKPPTPLILGGWWDSTDQEKHERWISTIKWAKQFSLEHLTEIDRKDQFKGDGKSKYEVQRNALLLLHDSFTISLLSEYDIDLVKEAYKDCYPEYNSNNYITVKEFKFLGNRLFDKVPKTKGIYFVISTWGWREDAFVKKGTGGYFKGKDPNVPVQTLWENWVEHATILYIGRAGGIEKNGRIYNSSLNSRISELVKYGHGKNIGHSGGRYLWQHTKSDEFRIYWYSIKDNDINPIDLEHILLEKFTQHYGKLPFANLRG